LTASNISSKSSPLARLTTGSSTTIEDLNTDIEELNLDGEVPNSGGKTVSAGGESEAVENDYDMPPSMVKVIEKQQMSEINPGVWDGLTVEEVRSRYPDEWEQFVKDPYSFRARRAESYYDLSGKHPVDFANMTDK
jgi:hypothetical protein